MPSTFPDAGTTGLALVALDFPFLEQPLPSMFLSIRRLPGRVFKGEACISIGLLTETHFFLFVMLKEFADEGAAAACR